MRRTVLTTAAMALALALAAHAAGAQVRDAPTGGATQDDPAGVPASRASDGTADGASPETIERFAAIREILDEAAEARAEARRGERTVLDRLRGRTPEDRANALLREAFEIVSEAPITEIQREIASALARVKAAEEKIVRLREERLFAPAETGIWDSLQGARTREAIEGEIAELRGAIADDRAAVGQARGRFLDAMREAGVSLEPAEADLLLDGVTAGDILSIAAAYDVVRQIGTELRAVMAESGEDLPSARRYYTIHTTLTALLAEAQRAFIEKVDTEYLPRLDGIEEEIAETRAETERLLEGDLSSEHRRVLEANRESQRLSAHAAGVYRAYLERQRDEVAAAHTRTLGDLRVADNTLRTVDASVRLLEIMRAATLEFETLRALESPGLDTIFENEALRREFESLSERLRAPDS